MSSRGPFGPQRECPSAELGLELQNLECRRSGHRRQEALVDAGQGTRLRPPAFAQGRVHPAASAVDKSLTSHERGPLSPKGERASDVLLHK